MTTGVQDDHASRQAYLADNLSQVLQIYGLEAVMHELSHLIAMSASQRGWVLRHHDVEPIAHKREIRDRQNLDALLHLCGILNAGWLSGAVGSLPHREDAKLNEVLRLAEVQRYFIELYPLPHMTSFLKVRSPELPFNPPFQPEWFGRLLHADAVFRDKRLWNFLLVVDDYWLATDTVSFATLERAVGNASQIIRAVTTPAEKRSELQSVICGLERFLLFCDDLQALIDTAEGYPSLQSAGFGLYQYWFNVRGPQLGDVMSQALQALTKVEGGGGLFETTEHSVNKLLQRAYGTQAHFAD